MSMNPLEAPNVQVPRRFFNTFRTGNLYGKVNCVGNRLRVRSVSGARRRKHYQFAALEQLPFGWR